MSERYTRQQLPPEEQRRREGYRHLVAIALNSARQYNGSEAAYEQFMSTLQQLEVGIGTLGFSGDARTQETAAALEHTERNPRDINDILSVAAESQQRSLSLEQERHPYVYLEYHGVFLQPGGMKQPIVPGGERKAYEVRFDTIVNDFVTFLRSQKIFADDIIITLGQESPDTMMRQESYVKVEIPRIGKTVLLCNQVGEATFVLQGYVPNDILTRYTKDDLQDNKLFAARKVVRGPHWQEQIAEYLFNEAAWSEKDQRAKPPRTKVPLAELHTTREQIAAQIREQYTPEEWVKLETEDIRHKQFLNRGMIAIATLFGLSDPIKTRRERLQLGLVIWPDSIVMQKTIEIEERTPEQWQAAIIEAGLTPEKWITILPREINVDNHKLSFFAAIFKVDTANPLDQLGKLRTGLAIWPDSDVLKKAIEIEERTPDQWREAIVAAGWTPEKWEQITDSFVFKPIDGRGLTAFETIFELPNSNRNRQDRLRLGLAIWPDDPIIKRAIEIDHRTPDDWRKAIIAAGWTPKSFIATPPRDFAVDGWKIGKITTVFRIDRNPIEHLLPRLAVGLAIWPGDQVLQAAYNKEQSRVALLEKSAHFTLDDWRSALADAGWTPERWIAMTRAELTTFELLGVKLHGLGSIFGMEGRSPQNNKKVFFQLGLAIWPNNPILKRALQQVSKK